MRKIEEIIDRIDVTTEQKERHCTNRNLDGGSWCFATNQVSCDGCRMFTSNVFGLAEIVVEAYERMESENRDLNEAFDELASAIACIASSAETLVRMSRTLSDYGSSQKKEKQIPAENRILCRQIAAEARKIMNAGKR